MARTRGHAAKTRPAGFARRLREIDLFFQKKDLVHQTMRRAVKRLDRAGIPYALVGGLALNAHNYQRTTRDVDLLMTREGLDAFLAALVGRHYEPVPGRPRRFRDRQSGVAIDVLVTGRYPGTGEPGPIAFPHPHAAAEIVDGYSVVSLPMLVQLKLAARCWRDFADVVELIRANGLNEAFANELHQSVRDDFIECLEEKRREDEYEARE